MWVKLTINGDAVKLFDSIILCQRAFRTLLKRGVRNAGYDVITTSEADELSAEGIVVVCYEEKQTNPNEIEFVDYNPYRQTRNSLYYQAISRF